MNKLVYSVFKAIMLSVIFIFIFDMASYLYRAVSLNARMESLSTSLKKVVMENNYLPESDAELYMKLLGQMVADFNGVPASAFGAGGITKPSDVNAKDSDISDNFISGMHWNYGSNAILANSGLTSLTGDVYTWSGGSWQAGTRNIVEKDMSKPRDYGDIQIVQLRVGVYQPLWGWTSAAGGTPSTTDYKYNGQAMTNFNRAANARGTEFVYTYYVPCMKYKTTNTY